MVFCARSVAQLPQSEGAEHHPSEYRYPLRTWSQPVRIPFGTREQADAYARQMHKLQSIVITPVDLHNITVATALDVLHRQTLRLDPDPNPETRGVDLFLRMPDPSPATDPASDPAPVDPNVKLTLTIERLPLLEALQFLASQAGLKVVVEPHAVSLVPTGRVIPNLVSASYGVPPELLGRKTDPDDFTPRVNLNAWFEAKGVDFPAGASAVYLTSTRLLIVRNTQENLDKVVSVISSALKPAGSSPANP